MEISNVKMFYVIGFWYFICKRPLEIEITSEIVITIAYESKKMWLRLRARITVNVRSEYPKHPSILNELYNEKLLKSITIYHVMDLT